MLLAGAEGLQVLLLQVPAKADEYRGQGRA